MYDIFFPIKVFNKFVILLYFDKNLYIYQLFKFQNKEKRDLNSNIRNSHEKVLKKCSSKTLQISTLLEIVTELTHI